MDHEVAGCLQKREVTNARGNGVRIAIFDTWPANPGSKVVKRVQSERAINLTRIALGPDSVSALCDMAPRCNRGVTHDLPDHGLFVASIIGDLAPDAEISVYQIFGDRSGADVETMAGAMHEAIHAARGAGPNGTDAPLVLNLSFGFGPPLELVHEFMEDPTLPNRDLNRWFKKLEALRPPKRNGLINKLKGQGLVSQAEHKFKGPLELLDALFATTGGDTKVLVVAASGNDTCPGDEQLGPRVPAAMERVIAASAFVPHSDGRWVHASYSNDDDFFTDNDGIGAMGGEVDRGTHDTQPDCSIYGPYTATTFPALGKGGGTPNKTKAAFWAGTSFAAPIVSAFAACIWSEDLAMTAGHVRVHVLTKGDGRHREYLKFLQDRQ